MKRMQERRRRYAMKSKKKKEQERIVNIQRLVYCSLTRVNGVVVIGFSATRNVGEGPQAEGGIVTGGEEVISIGMGGDGGDRP